MAESVDNEVCTLTISETSESPSPDNIPAVLEPAGLTEARRKYLIEKGSRFAVQKTRQPSLLTSINAHSLLVQCYCLKQKCCFRSCFGSC